MSSAVEEAAVAVRTIKSLVPISRINKGEMSKIIEEVDKDGLRVIVRNNQAVCVLMSVPKYNELSAASGLMKTVPQSAEWDKKRAAFLKKIREHVAPPLPASLSRKEVMDRIGPIDVDADAVAELRRVSVI